ncbi:glycoside hydrolase family 10 protein, partial [Patescibacteria group bacterium]
MKKQIKVFFEFPENRALFWISVLVLVFFVSLNWMAWGGALFNTDNDKPIPGLEGNKVFVDDQNKGIAFIPGHLPEVLGDRVIESEEEKNTENESDIKSLPEVTDSADFSDAEVGPAIWVNKYDYKNQGDLEKVFVNAKKAGFKTVFFQARDKADAYYRSLYEPWAQELSGKLGKNPGWDPLAVAVAQSKKHKLKLHAWVNVYTVWKGEKKPSLGSHLYNKHEDWLMHEKDKGQMKLNPGYTYISPGNPNATNYLYKVMMDIASRYDVDGIHFDKFHYPTAYHSYDPVSLDRFRRQYQLSWDEWRVAQLDRFLVKVQNGLNQRGLKTKVSSLVYGRYEEGKRDFGQDSVAWVKEKTVDFICPLIPYSSKDYPRFDLQVEEFKARV